MVAPRSPTNWPMNAMRASMSTGGAPASVTWSVVSALVSGLVSMLIVLTPSAGGTRGGCWDRTLLPPACRAIASALQQPGWRVGGEARRRDQQMRAREPDDQGYVER